MLKTGFYIVYFVKSVNLPEDPSDSEILVASKNVCLDTTKTNHQMCNKK